MDDETSKESKIEQPTRQWIIKFLIAAIILILVFVAFNHFNTRSKQQNIKKTVVTNTKNVPSTFKYDTKKAETLLTEYIKQNIKPEFIPAKIEVNQARSLNGTASDLQYEFGVYSTVKQAILNATLHYKENTNNEDGFVIFINPPDIKDALPSVAQANSLNSLYFTNPYSITECKTKDTSSYCESFKIETEGKRGYGIVFGLDGSKFTPTVFTCYFPKESKFYSLNSCIRL